MLRLPFMLNYMYTVSCRGEKKLSRVGWWVGWWLDQLRRKPPQSQLSWGLGWAWQKRSTIVVPVICLNGGRVERRQLVPKVCSGQPFLTHYTILFWKLLFQPVASWSLLLMACSKGKLLLKDKSINFQYMIIKGGISKRKVKYWQAQLLINIFFGKIFFKNLVIDYFSVWFISKFSYSILFRYNFFLKTSI